MKRFYCSGSMLVLLSSYTLSAQATTFDVDSSKSSVNFLAVGKPGFLKIKGGGATVSGSVKDGAEGFSGTLTVQLADLKTGLSMRDDHMQGKYLESSKFPTAVLKLNKVVFQDKAEGSCTFEGNLELKGKSKEIGGTCKITGLDSDVAKVNATLVVKIEDYPIGIPSHLGVTVADQVTITADLQAPKKK